MSSYSHTELNADRLGDLLPSFLTTTPWQVKLAQAIFNDTGDKKLKSFFGAQGWNTGLIDKMYTLSKKSLLSGASMDIYIKGNANVELPTAQSFMKHLSEFLGKDVKEGIAADLDTLLSKAVKATGNVLEGAGDTAKTASYTVPLVLLVLAGGVAGYLIFAGKKGVKLTPM